MNDGTGGDLDDDNKTKKTGGQFATLPLDNPLWRYACQYYSKPGVEAQLLKLQDEQGADINLILQGLWLASMGQAWSLDCIGVHYPKWQAEQVVPLRTMRREMKRRWVQEKSTQEPATALGGKAFEAFRQQLKALELEAEKYGLALLYEQVGGQSQNLEAEGGELFGENQNAENLKRLAEYFQIPGLVLNG